MRFPSPPEDKASQACCLPHPVVIHDEECLASGRIAAPCVCEAERRAKVISAVRAEVVVFIGGND